jgi:hypothetical protein
MNLGIVPPRTVIEPYHVQPDVRMAPEYGFFKRNTKIVGKTPEVYSELRAAAFEKYPSLKREEYLLNLYFSSGSLHNIPWRYQRKDPQEFIDPSLYNTQMVINEAIREYVSARQPELATLTPDQRLHQNALKFAERKLAKMQQEKRAAQRAAKESAAAEAAAPAAAGGSDSH